MSTNGNGSDPLVKSGHPKKRAMLAALAKLGNVSAAARAAGIARQSHYLWMDNDPEYVEAVRFAMEEATEGLEELAVKYATEGFVEQTVVRDKDGETVSTKVVRKPSMTMLIFTLKALKPEKYRERYEVQHDGKVETSPAEILKDRDVAIALERAAIRQGFAPPDPGSNGSED